jgi:hypothetical protein
MFNAEYPQKFAQFTGFLARNGLPSAYSGNGAALAEFDASIENAARATGVVSDARPRPGLRQRLGQLRRNLTGKR